MHVGPSESMKQNILLLRQLYSASEIVKSLLGQLKIDAGLATGVKRQLTSIVYRRYLHRRYLFRLATVSARQIVGLQG